MNAFKRNLLIGYGVSLLLLILSSAASYVSIHNLLDSAQWVNHTNEVLKKLDGVVMATKEGEASQRGYLLAGNEQYLPGYKNAYQRAGAAVAQVKQLTADNAAQQTDVNQLQLMLDQRFRLMQEVIDAKTKSGRLSPQGLEAGRETMNQLSALISRMEAREQTLLTQRTDKMNRFIASTPVFIIMASLFAIIITVLSFFRVNKDFEKRMQLQRVLEQKDEDINRRLNLVQEIAGKVASGDYKVRVGDEGHDALGSISGALNKMAESLDASFTNLSQKEWLQTGIANLNDHIIGENNLDILTHNVIDVVATHTRSQVAAFYLANGKDTLALSASIGLNKSAVKNQIAIGEGIAGQSALSAKELHLADVTDAEMSIDFSAGRFKPKAVIAVPVFYEKTFKGVIELASLYPYEPVIHDFLKEATLNIGIAIHNARNHQRLHDLLAETQAQSEELQAQQSELENTNAELEAQTEKLQTSEEELRVQQEELQQANQELEERSKLLEEKNELIVARNIEIQGKAEELALSTKYKSEFLANMSHELRTPLNSILLLSRLLTENHEGNLSPDQIEYASVIQSSGTGLLTLIDEILDLSKIESGKMDLEYGDVKLEEIVTNLRSLFAPVAKEKNLSFTIAVQDGTAAVMETDRLRVEQILRNLISNALKFTKKGSVNVSIQNENTSLAFIVKDTGIGIPQDKQQTIFEAFQQADGSTRRQFGGTGLGLSISRELARLLGGEIRLESEEGKGSAFTLVLPQQKVIPAAAPKKEQTELHAAEEAAKTAPARGEDYIAALIPESIPDDRATSTKDDKIILIIEDDTGFARSLLNYTRRNGYKGIVAVRGDEGIELAKRHKPLGILLDVQLPVKSGWDVMEELKSDPVTRPIPVHMMSSHEVKTKSLSQGAVDFINKPVAFEKLGDIFQKIEQALSRHPKKVLIIEENTKHAQALAYFLESYQVTAEIKNNIEEGIHALNGNEADCVILDMGVPAQQSYDVLEDVKKTPGLENLPIIVFTGKNLSHVEERRLKQYADSIVVKTAHSYQRILDEVSLFLHIVEENKRDGQASAYKRLGALNEVLKGKTVLIADDDVRNIFSLTRSLESYGMNIVSAIDGKEALKQLEETGNVNLVLMDMMMPEMDGYETTRRIRQNAKYRNLPIIAVTAKAMTGDREKCIAAGTSDYVTKPIDVDQLISLLRVWLYQ